jgi:hypothetical protein
MSAAWLALRRLRIARLLFWQHAHHAEHAQGALQKDFPHQ